VRHGAAEPVGVDVEESEVGEQAKLLGEVSGNVAVVEVDSGDGADLRVVKGLSAENVGVVADIGPHPVEGKVFGIRENGLLPCLQRYVRVLQTVVLEAERGIYGYFFPSVTVLVLVVQKLALLDEGDFGVAERAIVGDCSGVCKQKEED